MINTVNVNKSEMSKEQINAAVAVEMMEMLHREQKMKIKPADRDYEKIIKDRCDGRLSQLYGDNIPEEARERADKEIEIIKENGYGAIFYAAMTASDKAREEGQPCRVGLGVSCSFAAYLLGISAINPLSEELGGYDLPCEFFLGFDGSREPEFRIEFSLDYENTVRDYLNSIFEEFHVEYGFNIRYDGEKYQDLSELYIIPDDCAKYSDDFYGIGDRFKSGFKVWDCDMYDDVLDHFLQIGIQGNYILLEIKKLKDLTGAYPDVNIAGDNGVLDMFRRRDFEGIFSKYNSKLQSIIELTGANTFEDYVKAFCLRRSTNVWENNAEKMFISNKISLDEIIASREDLFHYLLKKGIERKSAYKIADYIRKGKALRWNPETWRRYVKIMKIAGVSEGHIEFFEKIEYLPSKACAVNNIIDYMQLAYYKVYYPDAFWKVYNDEKDF